MGLIFISRNISIGTGLFYQKDVSTSRTYSKQHLVFYFNIACGGSVFFNLGVVIRFLSLTRK